MKVTEQYFKPRNRELHNCHTCKKPIDFTKLIQYKYSGSNALVYAQVGFMDGEGNPVCLCPECRLLAYKRLGQNMTEAEYRIVDAEPRTRKTKKIDNAD
jgi:hypothetical protein